ncbi:amidohydrolase family protein [Geobacter sp.]|uniref:amidohydrolase family protein n=1 Tax=Geobacter sp. TaxID=46610 RepID=UPI0027BA3933|nr:amidohydrolase family protein [Geobacter sp.]
MTVIDIHCHTAGIGAGDSGCFISPKLRRSWKYPIYLKSFGVTNTELEREGDCLVLRRLSERLAASSRVQAAVVLAMDGVVDSRGILDRERTEMYIPNDFLARECRQHPNLLFGASVNPLRPDALERLDAAAAAGAVLVKWLPSIQGTDPADRRLVPYYRRLAELGLPLLTHTGLEESFTRADNTLADPARLRLPLEEGVTVIAAHCATSGRSHGEENLARLLPLFAEFPSLYADISALTQVNRLGHLPRVLQHREIHGRLLYGTDMPLPATGLTSPWFHLFRLGPVEARRLAAIGNPWDQDVELKLALGMPEEILFRTARVLKIDQHQKHS